MANRRIWQISIWQIDYGEWAYGEKAYGETTLYQFKLFNPTHIVRAKPRRYSAEVFEETIVAANGNLLSLTLQCIIFQA